MNSVLRQQLRANLEGLGSVDLLPRQFREQRQIHRTIYAWTILTLASTAILAGTIAAFWARAKQIESQETQLLADAAPLIHVRDDVIRMRDEIESLRQSCSLVESVKPSDDLLQSLAAIAVVSQEADANILIDSIDIRMPLEYPPTLESPPNWARSELVIKATIADDVAATKWVQKINASDRISHAVILPSSGGPTSRQASVTATPLAIRDLP